MTADEHAVVDAERYVGAPVARKEDPRLLSGRGSYVADVQLPGMLHACFVGSTHARAAIRGIDASEALALPGVHAVLTAADLVSELPGPQAPRLASPEGAVSWQIQGMARDRVRMVGEPIALVVASSRYVAEDAAALVQVDYEPQPAVVTIEDALTDRELVNPHLGSNVLADQSSPPDPELDAAFAAAEHVVVETFHQHWQSMVPMETRGVVASWDPHAPELRIWIASANHHETRLQTAVMLGLPEQQIRVTINDVGGSFGQKASPAQELLVVAAAYALRRPVKWIEDRSENLLGAGHARSDRATVELALDGDGRILGMRVDHVENLGAWVKMGGGGRGVVTLATGPYRVPHLGWRTRSVHTNTCWRCPYRGPWMFETVLRERMMDTAARAIGMDPVELRRRNILRSDELPYMNPGGREYHDISPLENLEQAAAMIGYDDFRREQARARDEGRLLGIGISSYVEPSANPLGGLGAESATIRIQPTGGVDLFMGVASNGQSLETTMVQVVADRLGVPMDDVVLARPDTATSPYGGGTAGSRSAVLGGAAAGEAAATMRVKLLTLGAHLLEAAPEDMTIEAGRISVRGTPSRSVSTAEVAQAALGGRFPAFLDAHLEVTARFRPERPTFSDATHICTCEVDAETGFVRLLRYVVSEDCGVMINPNVVHGQVAGGVVQGIGGVFYEHFDYDADGNPLSGTFMDYLLPTIGDVPTIEFGHTGVPAGSNPGGFKGLGEGGAIVSPPAIVNAVADALAPLGVVVPNQRLTPSDVFALISGAPGASAVAPRWASPTA